MVAAGFGLGAVGVQQGWWVAGSLSNLGQIDAIIMMAAGGGGGVVCILAGLSTKCLKKDTDPTIPVTQETQAASNLESKTQIGGVPPASSMHSSVDRVATPDVRSQAKSNSQSESITREFTPEMVEALGGSENVLQIPIIENWPGFISDEHLTAPVMRGYHNDGRPFLLFCYMIYLHEYASYKIQGEYLGRTKNNAWEGAYAYPSELNLRSPNPIQDNTEAATHMLDKITRLMQGLPIGSVQKFPGICIVKPSGDKATWTPENARLEGEELRAFMDLDTLFYERKPPEQSTELVLYDPSQSLTQNLTAMRRIFSNLPEAIRLQS